MSSMSGDSEREREGAREMCSLPRHPSPLFPFLTNLKAVLQRSLSKFYEVVY